MRLSPKQLSLALLLVCAICAAWQIERYQIRERANAAYHLLEQRLSGQQVLEGSAPYGDMFKLLLGSDRGLQFLRLLDSKYDTVVFQESRNAVYYIHPRESQADTSCMGTVVVNADEGPSLSGHAGFPHYIHLQGLQLEGDVLSIDFATSGDDDDKGIVKLIGLVPGELYSRRVDLGQTTRRQISYDDLALSNPLDD